MPCGKGVHRKNGGRMELNTRSLRVFVELARTGSFSGAAKALGLSQPAVSLQVQSLEKELGLTLVERSRGRCRLTEAGKAFLHRAQRILREEELLQLDLEGLREEVAGSLVIAASNIPGEHLLPRLLPKYMERYPRVRVRVDITDSVAALDKVRSGQADIGCIGKPVEDERLECGVLCSDVLVVIAPPDSELACRKRMDPRDLAFARWIKREEGSGTLMFMEKALEEWGISPGGASSPVLGSNTAVIQSVASGAGISMISLWAAADSVKAGRVVILELPGMERRRQFFHVRLRRRPLSTPTKAFVELLEKERPRLEEELEALRPLPDRGTGTAGTRASRDPMPNSRERAG